MSAVQRKARPLTRGAGSLRDDRLFIVACDDTYAPRQYFNLFRLPRVQIHVIPTIDGTSAAEHVLRRLLEIDHEDDDERWLLLDTDHYTHGSHLQSFMAALGEANRQGINIALSKPCFEIWLLLHHVDEQVAGSLSSASEVESSLRMQLGQYNKAKLRAEDYPGTHVSQACLRAERLDQATGGTLIPLTTTTRVYQLWRSIAAKALRSQLPPEFWELIP
jgi:hypothetical protein